MKIEKHIYRPSIFFPIIPSIMIIKSNNKSHVGVTQLGEYPVSLIKINHTNALFRLNY